MSTNWYIVKVSHGQERKLNDQFNEKIALGKIKNVIRFICPLEEKIVTVKGKKIKKGSVIYNGYLYFETEKLLSDDELKTISLFPNIMSIMGTKIPKLVSKSDVSKILKDEELNKHIEDKSSEIKKDQKVRIITGVFEGLVGIVSNLTNDGVEVNVNIFERETKVIVPLNNLIKTI
jgi:transcription antitermination factor NusG